MSASTVSITATNPTSAGPTTRRRSAAADSNLAAAAAAAADPLLSTPTPTTSSFSRDPIQVVKKPLPAVHPSSAPTSARRGAGATSSAPRKHSKPVKPRWLTIVSILTKNLLLLVILFGLVQLIRRLYLNSNPDNEPSESFASFSGDVEGKFAEMESFVKKTAKMMQVQIEVVDKKLESGIRSVKDEMNAKLDEKTSEIQAKLDESSVRTEKIEKLMSEFNERDLVSRDELNSLLEEYMKMKGSGEVDNESLDAIRVYAREIVEKEIERHAADGLGMVDYALASGGAYVMKHSEPFSWKSRSGDVFNFLTNRNMVHSDADKMLTPSFGEPGQCFPLKGDSGFVQIRLRTAIVPEAVTLEHVAKSVAYDRSSAPKNCRVSGWLHDKNEAALATETERMFLLTEFVYDLDKSNAQTFKFLESASSIVVDTIRLDFTSNHGKPHTCIYRLRVHGREPSSLITQPSP